MRMVCMCLCFCFRHMVSSTYTQEQMYNYLGIGPGFQTAPNTYTAIKLFQSMQLFFPKTSSAVCHTMEPTHGSTPSASSSSGTRKRKADQAEGNFFACVGLPVTDRSLREVLARVSHDDNIAKSSRWRASKVRFQHQIDSLAEQEVEVQDGKVTLYTTSLQKYVNTLQEKQPQYIQFVKKILLAEQRCRPEGVDGILYMDECVPGNILAPDNRRKSYCIYFSYKALAQFRSVNVWWPIALLRHSQTDRLPGGAAEFFTKTLRMMLPDLSGLVIDNTMVVVQTLFLIADEAALKMCAGSKGASGLRPCLHCDAFSAAREDIATRVGRYAITCSDFNNFTEVTDDDVAKIIEHLRFVKETQSKTAFEEAQKLLGWVLNEQIFFLDEELKNYLQPSRCHYDAMHCYWSNGQVNVEIGLFYTQAVQMAGLVRKDLESFLDDGWKRTNASGTEGSGNLANLVSVKLLKVDLDYKGSASQTLELLPLLACFAVERLSKCKKLKPHIDSLLALWEVTSHILHAKNCVDSVHGLQSLQKTHLELFISCYGPQCVKPKHHFASHIEKQSLSAGILLDCFPGERKNNTFKHVLCPRINRLDKFEKSILLRWLEHDAEKLSSFHNDEIILRAQMNASSSSSTKVAKHVECIWGQVDAGSFVLVSPDSAIKVLGCMQKHLNLIFGHTV